MILITVDMDWAPDAVIADGLDLLANADAKVTVFATHRTPTMQGLSCDDVEVGIHPNYLPLLSGELDDRTRPLLELLDVYPGAQGIRTHGIVQSAALHADWVDAGLRYESHQYFPEQLGVFRDFSGLYRVPVYWSDAREIHLPHPFEVRNLLYDPTRIAVFVFHFVHIYLNTESGERYDGARPDYHDPDRLAAHRNRGPRKGVRDFLQELLAEHAAAGRNTLLCSAAVDACEHACRGEPATVMKPR